MADIFIVRQPVFDRTDAAVGYELRFRERGDDGDPFARSYLSGAFDVFRGGLPAYVRASRAQLLDKIYAAPDPQSLVVLLPPDLSPDGDVVEAVSALSRSGVLIALDEFTLPELPGSPVTQFLPLARAVRIDLRDQDASRLGPMVASLKKLGKHVIADHVIDERSHKNCVSLGFEGFQGPHFSRPEPLPAAEIPTSTATAIRLMALARDMNTSERELERVISADPGITFQLLRIVNSAALGGRGITSISHALRLVGRNNVIRWLALASFAVRTGKSGVDDELVRHAVQRAHFCEAMAAKGGRLDRGTAFLVGLFSLLDAVFRIPLPDVLERVNLAPEVMSALVDRQGPFAQMLQVVESYELELWEFAAESAEPLNVPAVALPELFASALHLAHEHIPSAARKVA